LAVGEFGARFGAAVAAIELAGRSETFSTNSRDGRRDITCCSARHCQRSELASARLAEICQALFGAAVDCRYMVRGKDRGQDVTNRKEINPVSTESVTTAVERVDHQVSYVRVRNWLLAALTVSSGAVDVISFLALGKIFTAFMTGNIAFLGMGIAGHPGAPRIVSVLASMAGFAGGVYLATKIAKRSSQSAAHESEQATGIVWPRQMTFALGISLLPHLCFLVIWFATSGRPGDNLIPVLLAVWALAMGNQSAAVRQLNVGGIFTTAATATFIFLVGDWANNRPLTSEEHRRLLGVLVSLVIGATAGTLLLLHAPIYAPMLPLVVTALVVAIAATVFRDGGKPREHH
jgi:uncharacterized membrane protein YoaK (UPF0700 family)